MLTPIENHKPDDLWRYYQRGYLCLMRSGFYFRQLLRPALSHVYFRRAIPLLIHYARANHGSAELPPNFSDEMDACPLSPRDLLHLDYAICLGYAEAQGDDPASLKALPVLEWPGPNGKNEIQTTADTVVTAEEEALLDALAEMEREDEDEEETGDEDGESNPPFDV